MRHQYILLVEDNPDDEALTIRAFKKSNIRNQVIVARDGAEAVEHLFADHIHDATLPALILLDLKLPKVDGLEVLRRIRATERTRFIPVVVLTASNEQEDVLAGYLGGASAYIRKPVNFSEFAEAVNTIGVFWLLLSEPMPTLSRQGTLATRQRQRNGPSLIRLRSAASMNNGQRGNETGIRPPDEPAGPWQADPPAGKRTGPAARGALRILILEDEPSDAELEQRLLKGAGLDFTAVVVDTKAAFVRQLAAFRPEVILSDFSLPGFSGEDALKITREQHPHMPFIFLSGVLGDDAAVELIRQGATDYVLKDRPARLASVVVRAVAEAEQRAERARLEAQIHQSQRLESLGQLAGGVAHDFNNLLGVISNCTSFVGEEVAKEPSQIRWQTVREDIEQVKTAAERAALLTYQLLAFARRDVVQPRVLNLNDMVTRLSRLCHGAFPGQPDGVDFFGSRLARVNRPIFRGDEDAAELGDHVSG